MKDEKEDVKSMEASEVIAELSKMDAELAEQMEEIEAVEEAQDAAMLQKPDFLKNDKMSQKKLDDLYKELYFKEEKTEQYLDFLPKLHNQRLFRRDV